MLWDGKACKRPPSRSAENTRFWRFFNATYDQILSLSIYPYFLYSYEYFVISCGRILMHRTGFSTYSGLATCFELYLGQHQGVQIFNALARTPAALNAKQHLAAIR